MFVRRKVNEYTSNIMGGDMLLRVTCHPTLSEYGMDRDGDVENIKL